MKITTAAGLESGKAFDQCRLARSVLSEYGVHFSWGEFEIDPVKDLDLSKSFAQRRHLKQRRRN
jgi:hypothetical protein